MKTMKKVLVSTALAAVFGIFSACGDDSSSGPFNEGLSSSEELQESSSSAKDDGKSSSSKIASSSSVDETSSSSEEASSSSIQRISLYDCSVYDCVSTEYLNQDILDTNGYGELLDTRNNKVYRTIVIGDQIWMAQNLDYATQNSFADNDESSWCYGRNSDNCDKYGRMYSWNAAVGKTEAECGLAIKQVCSVGEGVQGVCPDNWHVPSAAEWQMLLTTVGGTDNAGTMLKSKKGWAAMDGLYDGNGTDNYGFSALPGGDCNDIYDCNFVGETVYTQFWSSTEVGTGYEFGPDYSYIYQFFDTRLRVFEDLYPKYFALYVRCVKNDD